MIDYLTSHQAEDIFRNGEFTPCGSVADKTKVGRYDEFDFQYLITLDGYRSVRQHHPRTRPGVGDSVTGSGKKCFYHLVETGSGDQLQADEIQQRFQAAIRQAISGMDIEYTVKKAGPAVKLVVVHPLCSKHPIRIDITLGIRADVSYVFRRGELTPLALELLEKTQLMCHFVAATDYWKICFLNTEHAIMKTICSDSIMRSCFRIIKVISSFFEIGKVRKSLKQLEL